MLSRSRYYRSGHLHGMVNTPLTPFIFLPLGETQKRAAKPYLNILYIFLLAFFLSGCFKEKIYENSFFTMDTFVSVKVAAKSKNQANQVFIGIEKEANRLDSLVSPFSNKSEVARINRTSCALQTFPIHTEVAQLIVKALQVSKETNGCFDITVYPLKLLWGFGTNQQNKVPTKKEIDSVLAFVDYRFLTVDTIQNQITFSKPGVQIDLGGIAKAYALSRFIQIMEKEGVQNYVVDAGGDVVVSGKNPNRGKWKVGLRHPRKPDELVTVFSLEGKHAILSSGDYERFFFKNGKRYHHIFDPFTGYPAPHCISTTILCDDPLFVDGYSSSVFAMGPQKGIEFLNQRKNVQGVIISEDGQGKLSYFLTENLKGKVDLPK